ncbi:CBO0543 family protein [Metabacillus malikii]|uniref:Uncharacterized protein n=1 Tax=Metabacillus malikii TaxID=1504265 RepID=A0ABT9ZK23_9BACI|nr:CBO0543 family protein [Metabacillus malikii]MDQ0232647.1 hypothetical protein [Metabacillus malikii]
MNTEQSHELDSLKEHSKELARNWNEYWQTYSGLTTWQFWVNVLFLVVPLVILFFTLDRRKAFQIGFFGYSCHVLSTYIDAYSTRMGHWEYPYKVLPILPISFGLDTSLIPVTYMLVYQWTVNHQKNYYIFMTILAALFAFVFKPILSALHLFQLSNESSYFQLFLWYFVGGILSKWVTNVFVWFQKDAATS